MSEVEPASPAPMPARPTLDRGAVLGGALELIDAEGLAALSLRALGARLGVSAMAIYNHVANKDALLDGVADLVAREIDSPSPEWPWRERLRASMIGTRAACLRHPNAIALLQATRATTPALLRPAEDSLDALAAGGFDPEAALEAWAALIALTMGHVAYELNRHLAAEDPPAPAAIQPDELPRINAALLVGPLDFDRAFRAAFDALIEGLWTRQRTTDA